MTILDIAENSVRAGAGRVDITLSQNTQDALQWLIITDNGKGMSPEMARAAADPFTTTRTTRKVGLGLPFLKMAAEQTGGGLSIESEEGKGTTVSARFTLGHIDLMPLGDIGGTVAALCQLNPDMDFVFTYVKDDGRFVFDTREARRVLDGVSLCTPSVAVFIKDHVNEGVNEISG